METINATRHNLNQLKLIGMQTSLNQRLKQAKDEQLGYDDFLGILLQDEIDHRKSKRIKQLISRANFKQSATLEGLDFSQTRGVDKRLINDIATCSFIHEGTNMIISGATGVGKSFLSQAIGNHACKNGLTCGFYRVNSLAEQFSLTRAKNTYLNFIKRLGNYDVLILDDFGIKKLLPQQYHDFYDVIDERSEFKSIIITTQVPIENWNEIIDDPVTCEAVTDRLVSRAIQINMIGDSYRPKRLKSKNDLTTKKTL